jgi:hypothetical protein
LSLASLNYPDAPPTAPADYVSKTKSKPRRQEDRKQPLGLASPGLTKKVLLSGAGGWIQQERPLDVTELMIEFLRQTSP